jgi:hypothetical protein
MTMESAWEEHIADEAAINAAWRWFRRNKDPVVSLSAIVARVHARRPNISIERIRREIELRMSRTRRRRSEAPR